MFHIAVFIVLLDKFSIILVKYKDVFKTITKREQLLPFTLFTLNVLHRIFIGYLPSLDDYTCYNGDQYCDGSGNEQ